MKTPNGQLRPCTPVPSPDGDYGLASLREQARARAFVLGYLIEKWLRPRGFFGDAEFDLMLRWQSEPERIVTAAGSLRTMNARLAVEGRARDACSRLQRV